MFRLFCGLVACAALGLGGCLWQNISSEERLRDTVHQLNDELRWHQTVLAAERVHPSYRRRFVESRSAWGGRIRIADAELLSVKMEDDRNLATSFVAFQWYDQSTMTLYRTTLRQRWEHREDIPGYVLTKEEILEGDPRLLTASSENATSGGEVEASSDGA